MAMQAGGKNICGVSIGVLSLESYFPKPPGHIKNPSSLPFTTTYAMMDGITPHELLYNPSDEMLERLIEAARALERQGVVALTGSCGFLALYQRQIAEAVSVPVFLSSLIQVPMVYQMTRAPVGVLTASAEALTPRHLEGVGAANVPIVVQGLEHTEEFTAAILRAERNDMDMAKVEQEVIAAGLALLEREPTIRAIVLECTDLPPYAASLQKALGRPIFDLTTLATMVNDAVIRQAYPGYI